MDQTDFILDDASPERHQRELQQRENAFCQEEHRLLFEQSSDAIFLIHPVTGEIFLANPKAAAITGFSQQTLTKIDLERLFPDHDLAARLFNFENDCKFRTLLARNDGQRIRVKVRSVGLQRDKKSLRLFFVRKTKKSSDAPDCVHSETPATPPDVTEDPDDYPNIIGKSPAIRRVCQLIGQVAGCDCTILLQGESGTGKGVVAQAIHHHSLRAGNRFVKVNCASLSETLLESELFGHVKGAFTGAMRDRRGRFVQADGGTILLDEINCMSLSGHAKLLRVLQDKEFEPVGSSETRSVDVRVIVASNVNLKDAIEKGTFREDLYYRLNVISIFLPPLRERKEDIPLLADHFLRSCSLAAAHNISGFSPDAISRMMVYDWPGNVRELENAVEHAAIVGRGPVIVAENLPASLLTGTSIDTQATLPLGTGLRDKLNLIEKQIILDALKESGGYKKGASELLKIDPRNLPYLLRKHCIGRGDW